MEEALFRERLGRTAVRGAIFGLLCIGLGAFLAWLYSASSGNHKHAVIAHAEGIPALVAWLRAKAPSAEGPPAF